MIRFAELASFAVLAAGLHVAAFLTWPATRDAAAPAAPGTPVAVRAGDAALQALVEVWTSPPEASARPAPAARPAAPERPATPLPAPDARRATLPEAPDRPEPASGARFDPPPPLPERPERRPDPPPPSQAAATGSAGRALSEADAPAAAADQAAMLASLGSAVRTALAGALVYPERARARGTTGVPTIELVIARDGRLVAARLLRGSGSSALDAAALGTARRARYPAAPDDLPGARFAFSVPLRFTLD